MNEMNEMIIPQQSRTSFVTEFVTRYKFALERNASLSITELIWTHGIILRSGEVGLFFDSNIWHSIALGHHGEGRGTTACCGRCLDWLYGRCLNFRQVLFLDLPKKTRPFTNAKGWCHHILTTTSRVPGRVPMLRRDRVGVRWSSSRS